MLARTVRRWLVPAVLVFAWLCAPGAAAGAEGVRQRSQIAEDLYDVDFVDADRGWAVGTFGAVYRTADGGRTWQAQPTPTAQHLYGVSFADAASGWAVGRSGEIVHTADGGLHWTEQRSHAHEHLFAVDFIDSREGWAVGDWGVVLHTADGGATWEDRSLPADQIVYAVDFLDHGRGWMVGEFGTILHTRDGGQSWVKQDAGTHKTFFGVAAVSAETAWAVGIDGLVVRTRDGGTSWDLQHGQREAASFEKGGFAGLLDSPGFYDVEIRGGKGYVVGDVGNVLVSEDGGETWTGSLLPAPWRLSWIRGLSVLPSGRGMLVGASGLTFSVDGKQMRFSQLPR
ncbi:MAG: hypothetical protein HYY35_01530 [Deltaproteobacteria bacterium]|nr:hypothetical protein [Deltaproteobacteria bacterium]